MSNSTKIKSFMCLVNALLYKMSFVWDQTKDSNFKNTGCYKDITPEIIALYM